MRTTDNTLTCNGEIISPPIASVSDRGGHLQYSRKQSNNEPRSRNAMHGAEDYNSRSIEQEGYSMQTNNPVYSCHALDCSAPARSIKWSFE